VLPLPIFARAPAT